MNDEQKFFTSITALICATVVTCLLLITSCAKETGFGCPGVRVEEKR